MENIVMTIDRGAKDALRNNAAVIEQLKSDDRFQKIGNSVFKLADTVPAEQITSVVGGVLIQCVTETVTLAVDWADGTTTYRVEPMSTSL